MNILFPIIDVSKSGWNSFFEPVISNEYIYTSNRRLFEAEIQFHVYCDCRGHLFQIIGWEEPETWRKLLRFLPNIYKRRLLFAELKKSYSISELKAYMLQQIEDLEHKEILKEWKVQIESAKSYQELISTSS